jgi:hypothetical protein
MNRRQAVLLVTCGILWNASSAFGGELSLGTGHATRGGTVTLSVIYREANGPAAVGVATDVKFDPNGLTQPHCAVGGALASGTVSKSVRCAEPQAGVLRLAVYGLNRDPVPDGEVATVTFSVAAQARRRMYRLRQRPTAADADGRDFNLAHRTGAVRVDR